jgi:uncharacterized protein (DUF488 family)
MIHEIFTIGHSQHSLDVFLQMLGRHDITAVADVRSQPYSGAHPHFSREPLEEALKNHRIQYVFLGKELGGRTRDDTCYIDGKLDYERLAETLEFKSGINRILRGMQLFKVVLLCAEKEPLYCHRCILVGRRLCEHGVNVRHILENGDLEDHEQTIERLLTLLNISEPHMFLHDKQAIVSLAYQLQGEKIAFSIERSITARQVQSKADL